MAPGQDIVLAEMLDELGRRVFDIHHHEIGLRVDGFRHPTVRVVEKLLPVVAIACNKLTYSRRVIERHARHSRPNRIQAILS
jgi:hypothetical protein